MTDRPKSLALLADRFVAPAPPASPSCHAPPSPDLDSLLARLDHGVPNMPLGVTVTDVEGRIVYTNPADAAMHGYAVHELVGRDAAVFAPTRRTRRLSRDDLATVHNWERESVNVRKDGTPFPVRLTSDVVTDAAGHPIGLVTSCIDITNRKANRALAGLSGADRDGSWDWDLDTDRIAFSPQWKTMLGYEIEEIGDHPQEWFDRVVSGYRRTLRQAIASHLDGETPFLECEYPMVHRNGETRWVLTRGVAYRDAEGGARRLAGSHTDVTRQRHTERQLVRETLYDALTGLPNRALFENLLDNALRVRRESGTDFAVLLLDLDRFQYVNDGLGYEMGDALLVAVARRLEQLAGGHDVLARVGGDEFAFLLTGVDREEAAAAAAERIAACLAPPFSLDGQRVFQTASVGVVTGHDRYERGTEILGDADTALHRTKTRGRAGCGIFVPAMRTRALERLQLEADLRCALDDDEFRIQYQPLVTLIDGQIAGFEALVRWHHPQRGLMSPDEFIPLAEETGLIVPLGWWVLREACRQLRDWQTRFPRTPELTLSVNLSALQFAQPDLIEQVSRPIRETGVDPRTLHLELTESMLVETRGPGLPTVADLRDLGVQIHLDDFGTGYSALSHLRRFPVDALKIDRSFVSDMGADGKDSEIVRCIVGLAQELGLAVVAEGVANGKQAALLRDLWCQYGQGYFFAHPVDVSVAERLLAAGSCLPAPKPHYATPVMHRRPRPWLRRPRRAKLAAT